MKRLARWLLNALTVLSLLLCVATAALCVRSYFRFDIMEAVRRNPNGENGEDDLAIPIEVAVSHGRLYVKADRSRHPEWRAHWTLPTIPPENVEDFRDWHERLIDRYNDRRSFYGVRIGVHPLSRIIVAPLWLPIVLFGALPFARAMARWRRASRVRMGACGLCGYDLTGNLSGVCPECGMKVRRDASDDIGAAGAGSAVREAL